MDGDSSSSRVKRIIYASPLLCLSIIFWMSRYVHGIYLVTKACSSLFHAWLVSVRTLFPWKWKGRGKVLLFGDFRLTPLLATHGRINLIRIPPVNVKGVSSSSLLLENRNSQHVRGFGLPHFSCTSQCLSFVWNIFLFSSDWESCNKYSGKLLVV